MQIGNGPIIKCLLDNGPDIHIEDDEGCTALHYAVQLSNSDISRMLIEMGANIHKKDHNDRSPLHYAAAEGILCQVQLLLDHGASAFLKTTSVQTSLHEASSSTTGETYEICKLLLEKGVNCNDTDDDGSTAFHLALANVNLHTVRLMLRHGANIMATNTDGETAIHFAAQNGRTEVLEFVLDQGFDPNQMDSSDYTPLHSAVMNENPEGCRILLKRGALINSKTFENQTALSIAVKNCDRACVQLLLEHEASLAGKYRGKSLLEMAAAYASFELNGESVRCLLVQHAAKMQYLNLSIDDDDRRIIENTHFYKEYYRTCVQELERMKEAKFYNHISLFNIMMGSEKVISGLARNEELVKVLEEKNFEDEFPIYYSSMEHKFYSEVKKQELRTNAANVLSGIFKFNDPFGAINLKILSFLNDKDLRFLDV